MDRQDISVGMEVNHAKYGRGCIVDLCITQSDGMDEVEVLFYHSNETQRVPRIALSPAAEATSVDATTGLNGLTVTIDDGFYTLYIEPDGNGTGYSVSLRAGNSRLDEAHLSSEALF